MTSELEKQFFQCFGIEPREFKSCDVGTFCPQAQEQLEAYKMEADEGKEINAELKAENKHLNDLLNQALKELEKTRETLTEIKEIAEENDELLQGYHKEWANNKLILQKISEVEDEQV